MCCAFTGCFKNEFSVFTDTFSGSDRFYCSIIQDTYMDEKHLTMDALLFSPYSLLLFRYPDLTVLGAGVAFMGESGYDETCFLEKPLEKLVLWARGDQVATLAGQLKNKGGQVSWDADLAFADGSVRPYALSAGFFHCHGETWVLVSGRENLSRKNIEEALAHSESLYREVQSIAHLAHWELDIPSGRLIWSEEIFRIFDMNPEEISPSYKAFLERVHPDDRENVDRVYRHSVKHNTPYDMIHRLRMQDGRIKFVRERGRTVMDAQGRPARSIGTVQDITALKEAEQAREHVERQLRQSQKLEAIGTLAGGIAHDFNNILFAMLGFTEMSLDMADENSVLHHNLQRIYEAGNRAKDLVNQILTFRRKKTRQRQPLQIGRVVKEALKLVREALPASILIEEHLVSESKICADETHIHQVVMNLCANGVHAMGNCDRGRLTVELEDVDVDEEFGRRFVDMFPGKYVKLQISDTGHGMGPEVQDRMFEPFFTTRTEKKGTGLGLSVVYGIVKTHEGQIMVYSEPDQGSTIRIFFPVHEQSQPRTSDTPGPLKKGTEQILLVDDERALSDLMKAMLVSLGYTVSNTSDPLKALDMFRQAPDDYDLVITDMNMPDMDGLMLCKNILEIRKDIKVIISTGFSEKVSAGLNREPGIKAILFKPVVKKDLAAVVRRVLDERLQGGEESPPLFRP